MLSVAPEAEFVLLVKPQFEVGKQSLSAHGLVNDHNLRAGAIKQVVAEAQALGLGIRGLVRSDLPGTHGNIEYVLWISPKESPNQSKWLDKIESVAKETK
jgi:23S rRNA (cytidine1920-2'-O)/16S rRNA (cytidine1409-2'-O)-methyltransferase